MHSNRNRKITTGTLVGIDPLRRQVLVHLDEKGRGGIAPFVQFRLFGIGNIGKQRGVTGVPRDAQRIPTGIMSGQQSPGSVIKITTLPGQCSGLGGLGPGILCVGCIRTDPLHTAQHNTKQ